MFFIKDKKNITYICRIGSSLSQCVKTREEAGLFLPKGLQKAQKRGFNNDNNNAPEL